MFMNILNIRHKYVVVKFYKEETWDAKVAFKVWFYLSYYFVYFKRVAKSFDSPESCNSVGKLFYLGHNGLYKKFFPQNYNNSASIYTKNCLKEYHCKLKVDNVILPSNIDFSNWKV